MKVLLARAFPAGLAVAALAAGTAGAAPSAAPTSGSASAYSVRILVPGQPAAGTQQLRAPPDAVALGATFAYPEDGSVVATGPLSASASTDAGVRKADGRATSEVQSLSLFGGEIAATRLVMRATARAGPVRARARAGDPVVTGLTILGQPVTPTANLRVPLADWGTAVLLEQTSGRKAPAGWQGAQASVAALDVRLTQAHAGLPAGTQILVASAAAGAQARKRPAAPPPAPPPPTTTLPPRTSTSPAPPPPPQAGARTTPPAKHAHARRTPRAPEPKPSPFGAQPIRPVPHHGHPKLGGGPYVFPVFGLASFSDGFGDPRADVGWHHGDDIFAPLGGPVLAVANGVVFSVGWNDLGGNRLWLKDTRGNEFYYAHLSAYSPLAVNGGRVEAGDVLGFVGNTGDAVNTPYHLHFEIHPRRLLSKGYDGVVDPTSYLSAWQHLRNLSFSRGADAGTKRRLSRGSAGVAPQPGAVLLQVADISSATRLDPREVRAALAAGTAAAEGQAALLGLSKRS